MGLRDILFGGGRRLRVPVKRGKGLSAVVGAALALESEAAARPAGVAALVFQPLPTADFESIVAEAEELLKATGQEFGTRVDSSADSFGYRWLVLQDEDFEDLVVALEQTAEQLDGAGYGDRLLCALFAFEEQGRRIYLIYNFKRGRFYPFVPATDGERARDTERELRLKAQLEQELPLEPDLSRWFPLWEIPL